VFVLLLGVGAAYGSWWLVSGRWTHVPNVAGLSASDATASLRQAGFKVSAAPQLVYSETIKANAVISTDPVSGSRVQRGGAVTLIVSKGQDRVLIPVVAGLSAADAPPQLQALRISLLPGTASSDTVAAGTVLGTSPPGGTEVKPNTPVQLIVSSGPPVLTVPSVLGDTQADASKALSSLGFKVTVTQDYSATISAGDVISQNPVGGSQLAKFQPVTIDVSKGPQTVVIPNIAQGASVSDTTAKLTGLGLNVKVVKQYGGVLGLVVGVSPSAGTTVDVGSTVTLYVV
jgi:serine/threonine-protein kinase